MSKAALRAQYYVANRGVKFNVLVQAASTPLVSRIEVASLSRFFIGIGRGIAGWVGLGDVKKIDYKHKVKALREWCHGFGLAYLEPNGAVHVRPVPIVDGKCLIEGRLLQ